jgi:hypothetical protein
MLSAGAPGAYPFFGASLGAGGLQITGPLQWPAN